MTLSSNLPCMAYALPKRLSSSTVLRDIFAGRLKFIAKKLYARGQKSNTGQKSVVRTAFKVCAQLWVRIGLI